MRFFVIIFLFSLCFSCNKNNRFPTDILGAWEIESVTIKHDEDVYEIPFNGNFTFIEERLAFTKFNKTRITKFTAMADFPLIQDTFPNFTAIHRQRSIYFTSNDLNESYNVKNFYKGRAFMYDDSLKLLALYPEMALIKANQLNLLLTNRTHEVPKNGFILYIKLRR